jgi:hypothetical protein
MEELLLSGRNRRDVNGEVIENLGFHIRLWNGGEDSQDASFSATCGGFASNPGIWNSCVMELPSEGASSERILKVDPLLCLMQAVVSAFDPDWATVMPDNLRQIARFGSSKPAVGWLFYAALRAWPSPRVPSTVRIVNIANCGNIAVVTEEQFSAENPEHLRTRDAVEAGIVWIDRKPECGF